MCKETTHTHGLSAFRKRSTVVNHNVKVKKLASVPVKELYNRWFCRMEFSASGLIYAQHPVTYDWRWPHRDKTKENQPTGRSSLPIIGSPSLQHRRRFPYRKHGLPLFTMEFVQVVKHCKWRIAYPHSAVYSLQEAKHCSSKCICTWGKPCYSQCNTSRRLNHYSECSTFKMQNSVTHSVHSKCKTLLLTV